MATLGSSMATSARRLATVAESLRCAAHVGSSSSSSSSSSSAADGGGGASNSTGGASSSSLRFDGMVCLIFGSFVADSAPRGPDEPAQTNNAYGRVERAAALLGMELVDGRGLFDVEYVDTWPKASIDQNLVERSRARGMTRVQRDELLARCSVAILSSPFPLVRGMHSLQQQNLVAESCLTLCAFLGFVQAGPEPKTCASSYGGREQRSTAKSRYRP